MVAGGHGGYQRRHGKFMDMGVSEAVPESEKEEEERCRWVQARNWKSSNDGHSHRFRVGEHAHIKYLACLARAYSVKMLATLRHT